MLRVTLPFKYTGETKDYPIEWSRYLPKNVQIVSFDTSITRGDVQIINHAFQGTQTSMRLIGGTGTEAGGEMQQILLTVSTNEPSTEIIQVRCDIPIYF